MKTSKMAVNAVIALFAVNAASINAYSSGSSSSSSEQQTISLNEISSFLLDANDIIADIDTYATLWIKPHACVWSECAVDDTDDGYTGDNRDGDEQWYQYRTQNFCANAAYSLYGVKKADMLIPSFSGCSRGHFINSFFTYGGADTLLNAVDLTPVTYSYNGNGDDNYGDDDGYSQNAQCQAIDYQTDDYAGDDNGADNEDRKLSESGDGDGYGGTLGCDADGKYVFAAFASESCDGNYFAGIVDDFRDYNKQHRSIGCHKIYGRFTSSDNVVALLSNSWSCDMRLYPNGCPDPYGKKEKYDFAVRTISHGGNPYLAYKNMVLRTPIHVISWIFLVFTVLIVIVTYLLKNEFRAKAKGGKNFVGYSRCLLEDITLGVRGIGQSISRRRQTVAERLKRRRKKRRSKSSRSEKKGKKKSKKSKRRQKESEEQYYDEPEIKVIEKDGDVGYAHIDDVER
mmetsp:Transcript_20584/g.51195  ORF Transcript_20584/g.51195 Transcript_20584/m.51195 type:complete len:456 (+) Transcript_20584:63-1430(+)